MTEEDKQELLRLIDNEVNSISETNELREQLLLEYKDLRDKVVALETLPVPTYTSTDWEVLLRSYEGY